MRINTSRFLRVAGTVARTSQVISAARPLPTAIHRSDIAPSGLNSQPVRMHSRIIPPPILPTQTPERIALDRAAAKHFNEKGGLNDYAKKNGLSDLDLIIHSIKEKSFKALTVLLYRGPFRNIINDRDKKTNQTPLETAIHNETNLIMIDDLLKYANPNIITANGKLLLVETIEKGDYSKAELLIEKGANVNIIDPKTDKTPLDYINESKNPIAIALLNEYGAKTSKELFSEEIKLVPGPKFIVPIITKRPTDKPSSPKTTPYKDPKNSGQDK